MNNTLLQIKMEEDPRPHLKTTKYNFDHALCGVAWETLLPEDGVRKPEDSRRRNSFEGEDVFLGGADGGPEGLPETAQNRNRKFFRY